MSVSPQLPSAQKEEGMGSCCLIGTELHTLWEREKALGMGRGDGFSVT